MRKYQVLFHDPRESLEEVVSEDVFADFVRVEGDFVAFYEIDTAGEFILKASFWRPLLVMKVPT
jgi:hypothetical protein